MIRVFLRDAERVGLRKETATIDSFDLYTRAFTVTYKGTQISGVFSLNGILWPLGSKVTAFAENGVLVAIE